jgi:uncharacterized protein (TIGR02246 family)
MLLLFRLLPIFLFLFAGGCSNSDKGKDRGLLPNEIVEAFNSHDAEKIASLWTPEGVLINLNTNETIQGKEALLTYFKNLFQENPDLKLKVVHQSISLDAENKATEEGTLSVLNKDQNQTMAFKAEYVKNDNNWQIDSVAQFITPAPHSNYEHLKELDWLIGEWIDQDEDDNTEIHLTFKWDPSKNYIIQNFTMKVLGQNYLDGHQIIGWDPSRKKIRSWFFDSNGGWGESTWSKDNNNQWFASTVFIMNDGRKASALHIYKKKDANQYIFSSVARDINGIIQPDIGPFTVVKKSTRGNP